MTAKITRTSDGAHIVFRLVSEETGLPVYGVTYEGRKYPAVYPSWRKAFNACQRLGGCLIQPVKVFEGATDRERLEDAQRILAYPLYVADWRIRWAKGIVAKHAQG